MTDTTTTPARAYLTEVEERLGTNAPDTWWVKDAPDDMERCLAEEFPGTGLEEFTPRGGLYWPSDRWNPRHFRHVYPCVPGVGIHVQWSQSTGWEWSQQCPAGTYPLTLPVWADPAVVVHNIVRVLFGPQHMLTDGSTLRADLTSQPSEAVWSGAPLARHA